jgi:hypothetical protein
LIVFAGDITSPRVFLNVHHLFFEFGVNVGGSVVGIFRQLRLRSIFFNDLLLNDLAKCGIDGVCNVPVHSELAGRVARDAGRWELGAALIAKSRAQVVFPSALGAMHRKFSRGHSDEQSVGSLDDLQVADDEFVVERDAANGLEPVARILNQFYANVRDIHS